MIYTLTLAPAVDLYIETNDFVIGGINHPLSQHFIAGGKGINVSMMLKTLGTNSTCIGYIGGYTGIYIKDVLDKMQIDNDFIDTGVPCRMNVKINGAVKETAFNMIPATFTEAQLKLLYEKLLKLVKGDILVICGATTSNITSLDKLDKILDTLSKRGVMIVADMSKASLLRVLKHHPFLIKPNKEELEEIFFTHIHNMDDVVKYAKRLLTSGAKNVLVSLGKEGAVLVNKKDVIRCKAPSGKVISTVSAGDSMVAGFIDEYLKTNDLKAALKKSVIVGSATAFASVMADAKDIDKLEKNNKNLL